MRDSQSFSFLSPRETKSENLSPSQIILACIALAIVSFLPVQLNQLQQQWDGGERISCGKLHLLFPMVKLLSADGEVALPNSSLQR